MLAPLNMYNKIDEVTLSNGGFVSKNNLSNQQYFVEFRAQGHSFAKIAKDLGLSKQTLINWSKELQTEIANYKAIELEQLQEQYFMTRSARIEMLGELLTKTRTELLNRDLSDVPTEKLAGMLLALSKALDAERSGLTFQSRKSGLSSGLDEFFEERVTEWSA